MQHKHWAIEAGVVSNCRAKIQVLFIHQVLWISPSDYRWTSHFTRGWEKYFDSGWYRYLFMPTECWDSRGFGLRTPAFWRVSLVAPSSSASCLIAASPMSSSPVVHEPKRDVMRMRNTAACPCVGDWCLTPVMLWWQWRFWLCWLTC